MCTGMVMLPRGPARLSEHVPSVELRATARPWRLHLVWNTLFVGGKTQALINYHAVGRLCEGWNGCFDWHSPHSLGTVLPRRVKRRLPAETRLLRLSRSAGDTAGTRNTSICWAARHMLAQRKYIWIIRVSFGADCGEFHIRFLSLKSFAKTSSSSVIAILR